MEGYPDGEAVQRMELGRGGVATPPCVSYRSISSRRGVASPAIDMGVLSIMGLGDGRGVILCAFFRPSASFSFSHCSAILPQSTAEALLPLGLWRGRREEGEREERVGGGLVMMIGIVCLAPSTGRKSSIQTSNILTLR